MYLQGHMQVVAVVDMPDVTVVGMQVVAVAVVDKPVQVAVVWKSV